MPTTADLLHQLATITNTLVPVAIGWHLVLLGVVFALIAGWHPTRGTAGALLSAPPVAVAVAAALHGNAFNAGSFALLAALIIATGARDATRSVTLGPPWAASIGIALVAFGAVYPHFLDGAWTRYFYAAPLGIIPCPTLAAVTGFALLGGGLGSRVLLVALAAWCTFYGLFGVARLGVSLDVALGAGALGAVALAVWTRRTRRSAHQLHAA